MRLKATILTVIVLLFGFVHHGGAASSGMADCAELAAGPYETEYVAPGVALKDIEVGPARAACGKALAQAPDDPVALFRYGRVLHAAGEYEDAIAHYRRAADAGYAPAKAHIGYMYQAGDGVAQDFKKAVRWYRDASRPLRSADPTALHNLARIWKEGIGVSADLHTAHNFYNKALLRYEESAAAGNAEAAYWAGRMLEQMVRNPDGYDSDPRAVRQERLDKALEWYELAVERGSLDARTHLGTLYEEGELVPQDHARAEELFTFAAERGHLEAASKLNLLRAGQAVLAELREAANAGDAEAQFKIGMIYALGKGVDKDYFAAAEWLKKAADQNYAKAFTQLGHLYATGHDEFYYDGELARRYWAEGGRAGDPAGLLYYGVYARHKPSLEAAIASGDPAIAATAADHLQWMEYSDHLDELEEQERERRRRMAQSENCNEVFGFSCNTGVDLWFFGKGVGAW